MEVLVTRAIEGGPVSTRLSTRRAIPFSAICVVLAALVAPAVADAGTLSISGAAPALTYQSDPAETNHLSITMAPDGLTWSVSDTGAPLVAGEGCTGLDAHTASCSVPEPDAEEPEHILLIRLGDMGDWASAEAACQEEATGVDCRASLRGGSGADQLIGPTEGLSILLGGTGDDTISGSLGGDAGISVLDGGPGADILSGDKISYQSRIHPVRVTLNGAADDGEAGENDAVLAAWAITGGSGDDTLVGDSHYNVIDGGEGNDLIRAGAGDDTVSGDWGADRVFGDGGEDLILGFSGNDALFGGAGSDHVDGGGGRDAIRGGAGRDALHGGRRSDTFYARDDSSDNLRGGGGWDRARTDRFDVRRSIESSF
jgi:RTX calcium-binding nonapeptide repeat (4 copies)